MLKCQEQISISHFYKFLSFELYILRPSLKSRINCNQIKDVKYHPASILGTWKIASVNHIRTHALYDIVEKRPIPIHSPYYIKSVVCTTRRLT